MAGNEEATDPSSPACATADGTLDDSFHSSFQCCVCLDLLYKPIVLACGHISCFWCVHKAMNHLRTSHCAICRQPYIHFPTICQLLHLLLLKIEPVAYKRREKEVLEEERHRDIFSPQFVDNAIPEKVPSDVNNSGPLEGIESPYENFKAGSNIALKESSSAENGLEGRTCKQVSVNDVLCALCKELLFQPAVLNCGHVFCESCLSGLAIGPLKCPVCQSLHPGEFPNICLDLDHFVEEQFPTEYAMRKERMQLEKAQHEQRHPSSSVLHEKQNAKPSSFAKGDHLLSDEDLQNVHVGVGCDYCGMYPIVGKRYKCKDCKEAVGFDLCESCYNTSSKLPGRFNQQHTPDHKFELDESYMLCRIFMRNSFIVENPHQDLPELYLPGDLPEDNDNPNNDDILE